MFEKAKEVINVKLAATPWLTWAIIRRDLSLHKTATKISNAKKATFLINLKSILRDRIIQLKLLYIFSKRDKTTLLSILIILMVIMILNINSAECMETPPVEKVEKVETIAEEIQRDNLPEAEELLTRLANENLTPARIQAIDNLINQELRRNPTNTYAVTEGNIHHFDNPGNTGNPGTKTEPLQREPLTWRDIALALTLALAFTISLYLIYKYWIEIRSVLFGTTRGVFSNIARNLHNPVQRAIVARLEAMPHSQLNSRFIALVTLILNQNRERLEE